ncbi:hypothetical protein [Thermococcus barophilus]|uniref:Uncharacterized protein n=1 Tax=Thermococcus barophilus TaxID=55802 RepID=A0A0S1XCQ0_THEBA|nr:hypothetical protein [Thermococcus barophilus]ALM75561.1 conserved exported hypothetical protein [Thermococcus barophilus]
MEWKSILIGFIIGALIAIPIGMAHTGTFDNEGKRGFWRGFSPMMGMGHGMGMMGYGMHGMMDDEMYAQMEEYMASGNFTEMHEEMEPIMEKYMGSNWKEMHEYCEKAMGIEEDE